MIAFRALFQFFGLQTQNELSILGSYAIVYYLF